MLAVDARVARASRWRRVAEGAPDALLARGRPLGLADPIGSVC